MTQIPFGFAVPQVGWNPPDLNTLPSWADAKRVCWDVETKDPDLKELGPGDHRDGCHIVGLAYAIEDGPAHYLPIRHEAGDNLDPDKVLQYFRDQARVFSGTLVGTNLGYDLGFGIKDGIKFQNVRRYADVSNADVLCWEMHDRYSLNAIAARRGLPPKDETVLNAFATAYKVHPKRDMYKLPGRAVAAYGVGDVRLPLQILRKQEVEIEDLGIQQIWDLECEVLPALVQMRQRGVRVNLTKVHRVAQWALERENELLKMVSQATGVRVTPDDVWKATHLARAMKSLGFTPPKNEPTAAALKKNAAAEGSDSVTGDWLDTCGKVGQALSRARDYNKLRTTFCARTIRYAVNGRVYPVTHQLRNTKDDNSGDSKGARYGRFSSEHYNIQQEPARDDEFGDMWRDIYEPDEGAFWVCSDWSQQEPRIGVHYAEIIGLRGAKEFADMYRANPRLDIHQALSDIVKMPRKVVKNFVNGRLYNMGDAKMCHSIKCPTIWKFDSWSGKMKEYPGPEGQAKIDQFNQFAPWLGELGKAITARAKKIGHVWTILRRRCNFPKRADGKGYDWTEKAGSRVGQGGAADQMKKTYVEATKAGIPIQLIVHDEFDYSETDMKRAKLLKELQMDTVKFNVPMQVDQEIGMSWGRLCKTEGVEGASRMFAAFHQRDAEFNWRHWKETA